MRIIPLYIFMAILISVSIGVLVYNPIQEVKASQIKWYQGKVFTVKLQKYLAKPDTYRQCSVIPTQDGKWVEVDCYNTNTMYIPVSSIVNVIEEKK